MSGDGSTSVVGAETASPFASQTDHLLRRGHQIAVGLFLDTCGAHDLTPLQYLLLCLLATEGPQDQVTLGGAAALDRTTVAVVLRNLEQRGLVQRKVSPRDRRAKIVSLTRAGAKLEEAAKPDAELARSRLVEPLSLDEREELIRLLAKLAESNNAFSRAPRRSR